MKKRIILGALVMLFMLTVSCRKIGCTDPSAENYSVYAQKNDASCIYKKSTIVTVKEADWELITPYYGATIFWDELTQEIISNSVIQVSIGSNANGWSLLPLTFPQDGTYSTTIEVVLSPGRVDLTWIDSDLFVGDSPGDRQFKIVIN